MFRKSFPSSPYIASIYPLVNFYGSASSSRAFKIALLKIAYKNGLTAYIKLRLIISI